MKKIHMERSSIYLIMLMLIGFIPLSVTTLVLVFYIHGSGVPLDELTMRIDILCNVASLMLIFCMGISAVNYIFVLLPMSKSMSSITDILDSDEFDGSNIKYGQFTKSVSEYIIRTKEVEQSLTSKANFYMNVIESLNDITWIHYEGEGKSTLTIPDYWREQYGDNLNLKEVCSIESLLHPDERSKALRILEDLFKMPGKKQSHQLRINVKENKYIHVVLRGVVPELNDSADTRYVIGTFTDINSTVQLRELLTESRTKYQVVLNAVSDLIYELDFANNTVELMTPNPWNEMLGFSEKSADLSKWLPRFHELIHPAHKREFIERLSNIEFTRSPGHSVTIEYRIRNKDGDYIWVSHTSTAISFSNNSVSRNIGRITDINEKKRRELNAVYQSKHDSLTGTYLRSRTIEEFNSHVENGAKNIAFILIHICNLEYINDEYGEICLNHVLKRLCTSIWGCQSLPGVLGRMSDDDFLLLISDSSDREMVNQICKDILGNCVKPIYFGNKSIPINVKTGVSYYLQDGTEFNELFKKANAAMYNVIHS